MGRVERRVDRFRNTTSSSCEGLLDLDFGLSTGMGFGFDSFPDDLSSGFDLELDRLIGSRDTRLLDPGRDRENLLGVDGLSFFLGFRQDLERFLWKVISSVLCFSSRYDLDRLKLDLSPDTRGSNTDLHRCRNEDRLSSPRSEVRDFLPRTAFCLENRSMMAHMVCTSATYH